jgi:hypothetical protein
MDMERPCVVSMCCVGSAPFTALSGALQANPACSRAPMGEQAACIPMVFHFSLFCQVRTNPAGGNDENHMAWTQQLSNGNRQPDSAD